jgi:hypothetical protein
MAGIVVPFRKRFFGGVNISSSPFINLHTVTVQSHVRIQARIEALAALLLDLNSRSFCRFPKPTALQTNVCCSLDIEWLQPHMLIVELTPVLGETDSYVPSQELLFPPRST